MAVQNPGNVHPESRAMRESGGYVQRREARACLLKEIMIQGQGRLVDVLQGSVDAAIEDRQRREDGAVEVGQALSHLSLCLPQQRLGVVPHSTSCNQRQELNRQEQEQESNCRCTASCGLSQVLYTTNEANGKAARMPVRFLSLVLYLRRGLLAADFIRTPGALDLAFDAVQALQLLVGAHTAVVQPVHIRPDPGILLQ